TRVEPAGQDSYTVTGDLTIKDATHPVSLALTRYGEFNDPGMMGHRIAYGATTKINRKDFGLNFSMMLDGRFVVSDEIQIMIEGEGTVDPDGTVTGQMVIDAASLNTGNKQRDKHLRSADFFDAEQHPRVVLAVRQAALSDDGRLTAEGTLEAAGITEPVTFTADVVEA